MTIRQLTTHILILYALLTLYTLSVLAGAALSPVLHSPAHPGGVYLRPAAWLAEFGLEADPAAARTDLRHQHAVRVRGGRHRLGLRWLPLHRQAGL